MKLEYIGSTQYLTPRGILKPGAVIEVNSTDKDVSFFMTALNNLKLFKVSVSEPPAQGDNASSSVADKKVSIEVTETSPSQTFEVKVEKQPDKPSRKRLFKK